MKKKSIFKSLIALAVVLTSTPVTGIHAVTTTATGDWQAAIDSIRYERQEEDGTIVEVPVTDALKETIDERVAMGKDYKSPVTGTVDGNQLKLNVQLFDVYLDNSGYKNGASPAGESFFNLLEFYADVLQVKQLMDDTTYGSYEFVDSKNNTVTKEYVESLLELIKDVYNLEPYTDLKYRQASIEGEEGYNDEDLYGGVDVIATSDDGKATFTFHMDHHGFWGYELAGDTFMDDVVGIPRSKEYGIRAINTDYANFMKILLPELEGKVGNFNWYIFNNTDLENPYMYVGTNSEGKKEALMIDVDFYGENVLVDVIKAALIETYGENGVEELDTLYIYLTHLHGDHVNNLSVINKDPVLRDKVKLIWPEAEAHPYMTIDGERRDLITLFDFEDATGTTARDSRVINLKDYEEIEILDHKFKLLSIPDQHSNGGTGLADTNMGIYYSGDTLGSQIHLGGTSIRVSTPKLTDGWLVSMGKTVEFFNDNNIKYIMTGHSPYPINRDYAAWMGEAIKYIDEQLKVNPTFSGTVVVENGQVLNGTERYSEIFRTGLTDKEVFNFASIGFRNTYKPSTAVVGDYEAAINEIKYDRTETDGTVTEVPVTDEIKEMIDQRVEMGKDYKSPVNAVVDPMAKTITLDIALVDVYLDNSEYKNGASPAGESYFNLLEFYADVLQVKAISDANADYKVIDVNGKEVDAKYVNTLVDLLDRVYNFDPTTDLQLRLASIEGAEGYDATDLYGGVDVIATSDDGTVSFTFHMDHHGFWGYELAGDTFMNKVVDVAITEDMPLREINTLYANFMQIKLPELETKKGDFDWFLLNNTDLENPYMYVGEDSEGNKEALMIDVDFYGENVINDVIKATIEERYPVEELDTLYIYLTHLHLDHVNNLAMINQDPELRDKVQIIWPVAEEHPTLDGRDLITLFDFEDAEGTTPRESRVINLEDGDQINILDHTFELLSIPDQHSNGGSGLVDTTMGIYYSGDTLGSQIHLGGTTVFTMTGTLTQGWLDSMGKTVAVLDKYDVSYILTGHTPYPINKDYAKWMGQAIDYIEEQLKVNPQFTGLVVVEEGKGVINGTDRFGEIFKTGLTDKEVFDFASVNFMNFSKPAEGDTTPPTDTKDPVKSGDPTSIVLWTSAASLALGGYVVLRKKEEE